MFGTEYYIHGQNGSDAANGLSWANAWKTGNEAMTNMSVDDSLWGAGTFGNDSLHADFARDSLTLSGAGYKKCIFRVQTDGLFISAAPGSTMVITTGTGNYDAYGIVLKGADHVTIQNLTQKWTHIGIYLFGAHTDSNTIRNVTVCSTFISSYEGLGIGCSNNSGGVVMWSGGDTGPDKMVGNRVTGCTLFHNWDCNEESDINCHGIVTYNQVNLRVDSNLVYDQGAFGYGIRPKLHNDSSVVEYNIVYDCYNGIEFGADSHDDTIRYNVVYDMINIGIYTWHKTDWDSTINIVIYNNTIYSTSSGAAGINIGLTESNVSGTVRDFSIFNNIVVEHDVAGFLSLEFTDSLHIEGYSNYNLLYNVGTSDVVSWRSGNSTLAEWHTICAGLSPDTVSGCDSNSINSDPGFIDAAGGDFRILDNSAAATGGRPGWAAYIGALVPVAAVTRRAIMSGNTEISGSVIIE